MAVEVHGTMIRIPQGDTGNVKFVADGALNESDKALFTIARRDGSAVLRKVLSVDESDKAFHLPFAYSETARMRPDSYEWSLRVVRGGKLDASGRLEDTQGSHTAILRGTLKQSAVDLWDTAENNPDNAPTLWADIAYRDGIRIAPETFTATNAAAMDELMWFGEHIYRSGMAGNVYTPEQAPNVWELVR